MNGNKEISSKHEDFLLNYSFFVRKYGLLHNIYIYIYIYILTVRPSLYIVAQVESRLSRPGFAQSGGIVQSVRWKNKLSQCRLH